jgi:hypothetical protein
MCPVIDNPASCKICSIIRFIHTKNVGAVEIHHESCAVYGQNVMNEGTVRQWCRMLKKMDEQRFTMKNEAAGHL